MASPDYKLLLMQQWVSKQLQKVSAEAAKIQAIRGEKGDAGKDGKNGKDGVNGKDGKNGRDGKNGKNGKDGINGRDGTSVAEAFVDVDGRLTLRLSDGNELDAGELGAGLGGDHPVEVRSSSSVKEAVKYFSQPEQTKRYYPSSFIKGINIIGVTYNGDSTVEIPEVLSNEIIITVKNETDLSATITVTTWS